MITNVKTDYSLERLKVCASWQITITGSWTATSSRVHRSLRSLLYTIHGLSGGSNVVGAYALLPYKTRETGTIVPINTKNRVFASRFEEYI